MIATVHVNNYYTHFMLPSLIAYVSSLPASAHPHLNKLLDWDNRIDEDLTEIAHHMLNWEEKLCTHLGLTAEDAHDIKAKHPELQRWVLATGDLLTTGIVYCPAGEMH
jgi:hypothetical protein